MTTTQDHPTQTGRRTLSLATAGFAINFWA